MFADIHRRLWIGHRYRETVALFHEERVHPENEHRDLVDVARTCAVTVFAENADSIVGDRDKTAEAFMAHVREHIGDEVNAAILESPQVELVC